MSESTMIRAATPTVIPSMEMNDITEINPVFFLVKR